MNSKHIILISAAALAAALPAFAEKPQERMESPAAEETDDNGKEERLKEIREIMGEEYSPRESEPEKKEEKDKKEDKDRDIEEGKDQKEKEKPETLAPGEGGDIPEEKKGDIIEERPPGWDEGEKEGWPGDIPPGLEERRKAEREREREKFRREIRREKREFERDRRDVALEKQRDALMGKVVTDIHGNRVRVEQFITRPESDQVKFTSISKRKNRLDYMWFLQEFNKELPEDIKGIAFRSQWPKDEKPSIFPETQTKFYSNTIDSVKYKWEQYLDKIIFYDERDDPTGDYIWFLSPTSVILKINGNMKRKFDLSDESYTPGETNSDSGEYSEGSKWCREEYPWDNTFFKKEHYIIDDTGEVADFYFYKISDIITIQKKYNIEQIFTASEFNGRTIDIIFIPQILFQYVSENARIPYNTYIFSPINVAP